MQWGAGSQSPVIADVVSGGFWSNADDFIQKPTQAGHSMQYWNPNGDPQGPGVWVSAKSTMGDPNTNVPVELVSFAAQGAENGVLLRWRTASETANAGFRILRGASVDGPFEYVHNDLIPGQGSTPHATDYEHLDENAEPGVLYHYRIEDVAQDGAAEQSETITAQAGVPAS